MEMNQDQMFKQMGESLRDYSPDVPAHLYSGIRKKLGWSRFLTFSATSFNVYYLGALLTLGGAAAVQATSSDTASTMAHVTAYEQSNLNNRTAQSLQFEEASGENARTTSGQLENDSPAIESATPIFGQATVSYQSTKAEALATVKEKKVASEEEQIKASQTIMTVAKNEDKPIQNQQAPAFRIGAPASLAMKGAQLAQQSTEAKLVVNDEVVGHDLQDGGLATQIVSDQRMLKLVVKEQRTTAPVTNEE